AVRVDSGSAWARGHRHSRSLGAEGPMMLRLALIGVALSGCGVLLDGAYLISGKQYHESVEQRRPTGEAETRPEVRFVFDGPRVGVACEAVTRGIDRVWSVDKTWERQGGLYRAHWLPVLLE